MKNVKQRLCGLFALLFAVATLGACGAGGDSSTPIGSVPDNSSPIVSAPDDSSTPDDSSEDGNTPDTPTESTVLATFDLGAKGSMSHIDGSESASKSYSADGYTLNITGATKTYFDARDAKGNSCIKVGSGSSVGSFSFTVPEAVKSVELLIAKYKDKNSAVLLNGTQYAPTKNSNDGLYDSVTVNTSSVKTVNLSTVSGKSRVMINTIVFYSVENGSGGGNEGGDQGGPDDNTGGDSTSFLFTSFEQSEKELFLTYVGEVIPFLPNNEYYVEGWDYENPYDYSDGLCFYTYGNTPAEFALYRALYADYTLVDTYKDDFGDTWYTYENDNIQVEMCCWYYEDEADSGYCVEIYACALNGSSGSDGGNTGGNGGSSQNPDNVLANDGKGLPKGEDGVYKVDLTNATNVKNVQDQGYYLGGCPTTGNVKVLVVPVQFSDRKATTQGYDLNRLEAAFNADTGTSFPSVAAFYRESSYGKLNLTFDVLDEWFTPANRSSYYLNATMDYYGEEVECGDQIILDEFLRAYDPTINFSEYDSDKNGMIDAIILINTLEIDYDVTMQWAYRYWNIYTDSDDYYYEYDGVSANDYLWASYAFLFEDENGDFTDKNACNTYTFIHEFGHVLGADDYYDTSYEGEYSPMGGYDIMDSMIGDHNPYTKFNYGWLTSSRLVVAEGSLTLTLDSFTKTGDTLIIANNWDEALGAYQEYFVLIYYTSDGLNGNGFGYFDEEGVVVYHVNASLYVDTEDGETYYDVYNNNTNPDDPEGYGTENDLVELIECANGSYVFGEYDNLSTNTYTDGGEKLAYVFTVNALDGDQATITFKRNN